MKRVLILLFTPILLAAEVSARTQTNNGPAELGTIRGTVVDPNGAVIAGAEVRATLNQTNRVFTTKTDDNGAFALNGLPFGGYGVLISALGFVKYYTQVNLSLETSSSPHNAVMQVSLGEVQINAQMVNIGDGVNICIICGYTYFSIPYTDLPLKDRDPQHLVKLQQGITQHKERFSIGGRRPENKTALLDGIDDRNPVTGQFVASLSLESISEFNADYTNADTTVNSSYGQNSAPLISAGSRSGTNTYHGQGLWRLGRSGLNANNFFTNRGGLPDDQTTFNQAAFTLGGNISLPGLFSGKDRAFFFTSYEHTGHREISGRQVVAPLASFIERMSALQGKLFTTFLAHNRIPLATGPGLADVDKDGSNDLGDAAIRSLVASSRDLGLARIDFNLTQSQHLNFRYYEDQSSTRADFNDSHLTLASPLNGFHRGDLASVQIASSMTPTAVNDFRAAYLLGRTATSGAGSDAPQVVAVNTPLGVGAGLPELPERRNNRSSIFADTFVRIIGAHSISLGAQVIRRNEHYANEGLTRGRIYYADVLALVTDGALSTGDPSRAIVRAELAEPSEPERYRFTDLYAFANDNWRASTRLALNYGLGYNVYSGALYERPTDRNNFAPFASFAYALTHSESIILRGGAAILYGPPTRLPYGEIKSTPMYPLATGFARREEIAGLPLPIAWKDREGSVGIELEYARDMRTAYTESAFFAVQHSIRERLILEVGYNSTYGRRLTRAYQVGRGSEESAARKSAGEQSILIASDGNSNYHALQVRVTSRERRRIVFQAHYTFSKAIDTASEDRPSMFRSMTLGPVDESNAALERAPSDFDRKHRAVGFFLWRGPSFDRRNRFLRGALADWQLSGIVTLQSGPRVSLYSSGDFFGGLGDFNHDGVLNDRLAYVGSRTNRVLLNRNAADGYFDRGLFGVPSTNGHAQVGRNVLPAPGYSSIDLSLKKSIRITETHRIELRADIFNITNRVNFAPPMTDLVSADFGRSTEAGPSRIIRLAMKYQF
jgi:hypothetical protein